LPIGTDVQKFVASFDQYTPYQKSAMAMRWVFFSAQQGNAELSHAALQPQNAGRKCMISFDAAVKHVTLSVVVVWIFGAPAQLAPEEKILHARLCQTSVQNLAVKLGCKLGIRR